MITFGEVEKCFKGIEIKIIEHKFERIVSIFIKKPKLFQFKKKKQIKKNIIYMEITTPCYMIIDFYYYKNINK